MRLSEVSKREMSSSDKTMLVGAGVGAGAGFLAAPGKPLHRSGYKLPDSLKGAKHGDTVHIPIADAKGLARHTGRRFGEEAHVHDIAASIKRKGFDPKRAPTVTVWNDRQGVTGGNHRVHAAGLAGEKTIPVKVNMVDGVGPHKPRIWQIRNLIRRSSQMSHWDKEGVKDLRALEAEAAKKPKPGSREAKINAERDARGNLKNRTKVRIGSKGRYYGMNAALIGGGAAAGVVGAKLLRKPEMLGEQSSVGKAYNGAGYGYPWMPQELPQVGTGINPWRRNPLDPASMWAAGRMMSGESGRKAMNRAANARYSQSMGLGMLYSPLGRGSAMR